MLDLHDSQSRSLVLAVVLVGAMGLVAAALITLLVTGRALGPIRDGFETQRRFVADASHELRTPAALIRANADVLEREGLVAPDGGPLVTDIIGEADRLGGLVGDLLQLSAWDEMRTTIAPAPVDAAAVAVETVRGATAMAAERGVRLVADPGDGPAGALADRGRLVQLLLILVDNAIDHSPGGGHRDRPRPARTGRGRGSRSATRGPASRPPTSSGSSTRSRACPGPRATARAARASGSRSPGASSTRIAGRSGPTTPTAAAPASRSCSRRRRSPCPARRPRM